ncbi:MAG: transposase [Scytonema sp. RU_4_4]|nr:transposase [Scytonema sp. RU_4_4]
MSSPQLNEKLERFHQIMKNECIRPDISVSLKDARKIFEEYIETYFALR